MMDNICIKKILKDEMHTLTGLTVHDHQSHFIESSADCVNDAKNNAYHIKWNFYGIFEKDPLIGFAMHGKSRFLFFSQVWLDRFMLDKKHQGKGYGKKSLALILQKMYQDYGCHKIYLSVHEDNTLAILLYEKLGFKKTPFKDPKGERIFTRRN